LDYGTVFDAGTAAGAQIFPDAAGAFANFDLKIARFAFDRFQIGISDQFDVHVPADLDQFG